MAAPAVNGIYRLDHFRSHSAGWTTGPAGRLHREQPAGWNNVLAAPGTYAGRHFLHQRTQPAQADSAAAVESDGQRTPKMARVEAALFVADDPLTARRLAQVATLADPDEAGLLVEALNVYYDRSGCAFRVERVASGYQLFTRQEFAPWLHRLHQRKSQLKFSPPALETLTIVAYRQPITRADVELIRGVQCVEILKLLMDRGLIRISGSEETLGRPYLYTTTRKFLETFGLRGLADLPMADQLRNPAALDAPDADSETDG